MAVRPHLIDHAQEARRLLQRLPVLRGKLSVACDLAPTEADAMLEEVMRFLSLCATSASVLTPSHRLDLAWHEFVLCTRHYAKWCEQSLGQFVHHDPGGDAAQNRHQFRRTLSLYQFYFGKLDAALWGIDERQLAEAACGACESQPR